MADSGPARTQGRPLSSRPQPLAELLEEAAHRFGDRPAIDFLGRRTGYAALWEIVNRVARGLQDLGVVPGMRVALCLPNTPHYPIFFFATHLAGGVVVNVNPLYVDRELKHLLEDSGAEVVVTCDIPEVHARVVRIAAMTGVRFVVTCPIADALPPLKRLAYRLLKRSEIARPIRTAAHRRYRDLVRSCKQPDKVLVQPDDVAVLQYTGGTTGTPKAAMLTHANLVSNADAMLAHLGEERPEHNRILGVLPLFHVFALTTVLTFSVRAGAEMILPPRFDLTQALATIRRTRITILPAVPTIYGAIVNAVGTQPIHLSSVRHCISGGAPLSGELKRKFEGMTGAVLVEGYGLSEASPIVACGSPDGSGSIGSAGVAFPGTTLEIRDPDDSAKLLAIEENGEICVRGPQVMRGYWGQPEASREVFTIDGALRTGDIGHLADDGQLFIVDRIKDVILCGGYNVYPRTIEEALPEHSAVTEAVVIGVPDTYRGQAPKAFVTLKAPDVTPQALRDFLRDKVNKIELPREIEILDTMPKTLIGKPSKKALVEQELRKTARQSSTSPSLN